MRYYQTNTILLPLYLLVTNGWVTLVQGLSSPSRPRILSVGLSAVDFVAQVPHFPSPDEKMRSTTLTIEGGGNAANTACAIGRLGLCESHIVTGIGTDANGPTILQGLKECNVNTQHVAQFDGSSPFTYILVTTQDQTRTCIHQPAEGDIPADFAMSLEESMQDYAAVHFDVRYPKLAVAMANQCAKMGIPYSVDVERSREGLLEILEHAEIVICNADYCRMILSGDNKQKTDDPPEVALRKVISQQAPKAKIAIQTLGGKGSCLIRMDQDIPDGNVIMEDPNNNPQHAPNVIARNNALFCGVFGNTQIVDTTGAGDSFQGGFLSALTLARSSSKLESSSSLEEAEKFPKQWNNLSNEELARALRIGSFVAAQKCQQPGARKGLPSIQDHSWLQTERGALIYDATAAAVTG